MWDMHPYKRPWIALFFSKCSFWSQLVQNPSGYISYRAFLAVTLPDDTRCNASIVQALKRSKHREFGSVLLVTFGMVGREKRDAARVCCMQRYLQVVFEMIKLK